MNTMVNDRSRIKVATFSAGDLSRSQIGSLGMGLFLLALGGLALWIAGSAARFNAVGGAAARDVVSLSQDAENGSTNYFVGGSYSLTLASARVPTTDLAVNEAGRSFAGLFLGSSGSEFGRMRQDWQQLQAVVGAVAEKLDRASTFSSAVSSQIVPLARLQKRLETVRVSSRAAEALARLSAYSETGFGSASASRAEFEVRVAAYELASTELRGDWAVIERVLAGPAKASVGTALTKEEVQGIMTAAHNVRARGERAHAALAASNSAMLVSLVGIAFFVAGLGLIARVTQTVAADFSRRFKRATDQFRGGEDAVDRIGQGLKAILSGKFDIKHPAQTNEFATIYQSLTELVDRIRRCVDDVQFAASNSGEVGADLVNVQDGLVSAKNIVNALQEALAGFVLEVMKTDIDARAAAFAAAQAADRAEDSEQVIKDSISRIDSMREGMQEASKSVKRASERGQEISGLVDLFSQVTEQIGVLSLNASLEAERAGDNGKGFRIVANEVRVLARRSEEAVQTMSKLVSGLQADSRIATEAVDRATIQIVSGSHVGIVANALTGASAAILGTIAGLTKSISKRSGRLRDAANQVHLEMDRAAQIADQSVTQVADAVGLAKEGRGRALQAATRFQGAEA